MSTELTKTTAAEIGHALLTARRNAGSPSMGMVLTFVVVTDEGEHYDALKVAKSVSREHPSRILGVIRRSARGAANLDAEIRIGEGGSGESVLLRLSGELANHAESVVLPLLLPDSPVVIWWPTNPPDDPAADPLGALAQRRITDIVTNKRSKTSALLAQCRNYAPGNTDLSWTRLTPWRALLAAALDQYPAQVSSGRVSAERANASADLMVAWLSDRLHIAIERTNTKGPGITAVSLLTGGGEIEITRPDGRLASFSIPNASDRPVALKRRDTAELLAEELRRLDPDDIYAATVANVCRLNPIAVKAKSDGSPARSSSSKRAGPSSDGAKKSSAGSRSGQAKKTAAKTTRRRSSP